MTGWVSADAKFETRSCSECAGFDQLVHLTNWTTDDGLVTSEHTALLGTNHRRVCSQYVAA